ncbi:MAG: hypothetical protein N2202_07585 [Proteobacteria bacterium]|nr:hypothetical protein [Pseudomonadota bacterium]
MNPDKLLESLNRLAEEIHSELQEKLVSFYLFGSITIIEDFHPGISDINTFIVFNDETNSDDIKRVQQIYKKFKNMPLAIPLMLKEREIKNSTDVFPIELIEIREHNRLLRGKDVLLDVKFSKDNIRHQCEMEIRAKIIGLRKMLFGIEDIRKNQEILYKSLTSTIVLLKQLLRLRDLTIPETRAGIIEVLEQTYNKKLVGLKNLYQFREKKEKLSESNLEKLMKNYLEELEFFSEIINEKID